MMIPDNRPFILLDDARDSGDAAPARLYRDPVETVTAFDPHELDKVLDRVAAAHGAGLHAAGYMSYEAGLILEERLAGRLRSGRACPLAWFGLFEDYDLLDPEAVAMHLPDAKGAWLGRSEEHTSELQSRPQLVCRLLLEKKKATQVKFLLQTGS